VRVDWDPAKDRENQAKHGIRFDEVRPLFEGGQDYLVIYDEEHSEDEDRFIAVGPISRGVVVVVHTEPGDEVIRIISARMATRAEEQLFEHRGGRRR
jgi:hypothetical protein